ncbi:tetratricopeptide repeat protein [Amycolatopsis sp. NPDC004625]|uniref:tetratricopeptide repeat protein n=1 Tax=Amycolatopsis sp. NPDC004625 TaxID=3154670 RepID=UPI0033A05823
MPHDPRIPGYLGRVLTDDGTPIGTCFQVSPGVLATAWHVLNDLGRGAEDDVVDVDALNGAVPATKARVVRTDPLRDLAVLRAEVPLPGSVAGWFATDWVPLGDPVVVTGVSEVDDPGHEFDYLDASGEWAGGTTRDREVPLGRLSSKDVVKGMSGAPVRRRADGHVVGVVSARYNSGDDWLVHTVWVARSEDVQSLLAGIEDVAVEGAPDLGEAVDVVLTVADSEVRLTGPFPEVSAPHRGVGPGLAAALGDVRLARARAGVLGRTAAPEAEREESVGAVSLRRAGRLLAESFLPEPVSDALAKVMRRATAEHLPVRIGVDAPGWSGLPWEAIPDPLTAQPLALCPLVTVFRRMKAPKVRDIPGPLRILVAISAPETGGGAVLDYERELRNVMAAVRGARAGAADVRVVPFATTEAIRAALDEAPAHVLHVSCHGGPGTLDLEDDQGALRRISAADLVAEAIPPGKMPPVVCLAACYTDVPGEDAPSLAAGLVEHGASVVIGTETSVTDWYATALFARIYQQLAQTEFPDVVAAVADARRTVQTQLASSRHPRESRLAGLDEWSVVTVLAATGSTKVFDPATTSAVPHRHRKSVKGLLQRDYGEFVGRRREQRTLPAALAGPDTSGVVLHGIGGVGKTTLAAELVQHLKFGVVAVIQGEASVDDILAKVTGAVRRYLAVKGDQDSLMRALDYARSVDAPWQERFTVLREQVIDHVPVLVVLDNFEDNLTERRIEDGTLAELLASWAGDPGESRLLITSRYSFTLPEQAHENLRFSLVGPMSMAETLKLIWALPALDLLDTDDIEQVWRLVGGHPRSLEYLDALLNGGHARFRDVTRRLANAVKARPDTQPALTADTLDAALAQTLTLIADDILLDELLKSLESYPRARDLLLGASVYRESVDLNALLFQIGEVDESAEYRPDYKGAWDRINGVFEQHGIDAETFEPGLLPPSVLAQIRSDFEELETPPRPPRRTALDLTALITELAATSLLTVDWAEKSVFVHRWTAYEIDRQMRKQDRVEEIRRAHARAAEYWEWRVGVWPQDRDRDLHDNLEARYHLIAADQPQDAEEVTRFIVQRLHVIGAWDHEHTLIHDTLDRLTDAPDLQAVWQHQLGIVAQARGDYDEAERRYLVALTINEELGNRDRIPTSYHQLGTLAESRGDYAEAERRYTASLTMKEELGDRAGMASSHHQLGNLAYLQSDYAEAERRYTESLAINEETGRRTGLAVGYHQLGILAEARGDYAEAERRYTASLTIKEELGDRAGMASSYHQLGVLAEARGDYAEAERRYTASLTISEELGDRAGLAISYHQLGTLAYLRGDYAEAERRYTASLAIREQLGDRAGMGTVYHQLGMLAQVRGNYEEAQRRYTESLVVDEELGNRAGVAVSYHQLGVLAQLRGDFEEAERLCSASLALKEELGNRAGVAVSYHQLGVLAQLRGDFEEAERRYARSLALKEETGNRAGIAISYSALGMLAHERGDLKEAEDRYIAALTIQTGLGDRAGVAASYHQLGTLAQTCGEYAEAERRFVASLAINSELGNRASAATNLSQLGILADDKDELAEAVEWHSRAVSICVQLNLPAMEFNLKRLRSLRERLGRELFAERASRVLPPADLSAVTALLDSAGPA